MKKVFNVFAICLIAFYFVSCSSVSSDLSDKWKADSFIKYSQPVSVEGIDVIKQEVSCGYAVIEMFSQWASLESGGNGVATVTEESLYDEYGKVVTSTGKNFCKEMNKRFSLFETTMYKNLSSEEFLDKAYESLDKGVPVPFEWAAKLEDEWTLHYSLLVGIDFPHNKVTVLNPYGYKEELSIEDFLYRTTFEAYEKMPLWLKMGFAFGVFEKNALFICNKK